MAAFCWTKVHEPTSRRRRTHRRDLRDRRRSRLPRPWTRQAAHARRSRPPRRPGHHHRHALRRRRQHDGGRASTNGSDSTSTAPTRRSSSRSPRRTEKPGDCARHHIRRTNRAATLERRRRPRVAGLAIVHRCHGALRHRRRSSGHTVRRTGHPRHDASPARRHRRRRSRRSGHHANSTVSPPTSPSCGCTRTRSSSTDSRDAAAQAALGETRQLDATLRPLTARLADWVAALGVDDAGSRSATRSPTTTDRSRRLAARAEHQMSEAEEHLAPSCPSPGRRVGTSAQRRHVAAHRGGRASPTAAGSCRCPPSAASPPTPTRRCGGPPTTPSCEPGRRSRSDRSGDERDQGRGQRPQPAAGLALAARRLALRQQREPADVRRDAVCGRRRTARPPPLDAREGGAPRPRSRPGLPWWDLVAPLPFASADGVVGRGRRRRAHGVRRLQRHARRPRRSGPRRAVDRRRTPSPARPVGRSACRFVDDRSLVLLNWSGSADSTQTTAHELGHAYHNTTLAGRTALQRQLPMALAETASIFCETLVVEAGLARLERHRSTGAARRRPAGHQPGRRRHPLTLPVRDRGVRPTPAAHARAPAELCEMMTDAQADAYGDGLDQRTAHPYMWLLKPHYYGSHFYNWPYTYGLLFGLGLFAQYQDDPERFRAGYDDLLSRAGMDTAEELGRGVRARRHRRGVLDGQPRRGPRPHRRLRSNSRRASRDRAVAGAPAHPLRR